MTPRQTNFEHVAATVIRNLKKRQMEGHYCPDSASAVKLAQELIPAGSSVGWGGSMTLEETGLMQAVRTGGYTVLDRKAAKTPEEQRERYGKICCADYFLMSTNAITLDGELVNIDGQGNRTAPLICGPQHVLVLAGMNKLVSDVDSGFKRVRVMAAPPNGVRIGTKTPCAVTGKCADCFSPDCMCCQFVVTRFSRVPNRIQVILIGEDLGY